jgi:antitoxin component YwqK of YwqJK toxin-antitoxin module
MTPEEYEASYPLKDKSDRNLYVNISQFHNNEVHKYTTNKKGLLHGIYRVFVNDNIVSETEYKAGMKDGYHAEWNPNNGYLCLQANYKNNMLHGEYIEYDIANYYGPYNEQNMDNFISTKCTYVSNKLYGVLMYRNVHTGHRISYMYINGIRCPLSSSPIKIYNR